MKDQGRTPLRTILQNFLNHVENLDGQNVDGSYEKEFQELKLFSELLKTKEQYCCSEGQKEVNRKKNRYKDILPFDLSRVVLDGYAGVPGSDYINANFIKGASGSRAYIASQGPLPHTVNDFWRMVVECKVQVIVMACNEEEAGKHKCENYWVEQEGQEKQFGMVTVRLMKASVVCPDFLVRTMMLKYTNGQSCTEERKVCQFHYSAWPDHGVPPLVRPLLNMVRLVRDTQASETLPVLIHCSAGCGRTGTICAIDYVWGLLRAGKLTSDFSLFKLVREMRKQRTAMVQTKEQYVLVHHAVRELFCEQLRMIDAHPYENIDVNGRPLMKDTDDTENEPMYEVIIKDAACEEKQDIKEKEMCGNGAPPLPHKKRISTASSKQEKEVENLTEKQRSVTERSAVSDSSPASNGSNSTQKPRIAKLKAIFERNMGDEVVSSPPKVRHSQQVTRSHSLGAVCKPDLKQLSPSRFGQNESQVSHRSIKKTVDESCLSNSSAFQPVLPIKRSKSLRVLGSCDQYKLSLVSVSKANVLKQQKFPVSNGVEDNVHETPPIVQQPKECFIKPKNVGVLGSQQSEDSTGTQCERGVHSSTNLISRTFNRIEARIKQPRELKQCHSLAGVSGRSSSESSTADERVVNGSKSSVAHGSSPSTCSTESDIKMSTSLQSGACQHKSRKVEKDDRRLWQDSKHYIINSVSSDSVHQRESSSNGQHNMCLDIAQKTSSYQKHCSEAQKMTTIVTGLGVRERRNSFRQAVSTEKSGHSDIAADRSQDHLMKGWTRNEMCNPDVRRETKGIYPSGLKHMSKSYTDVPRSFLLDHTYQSKVTDKWPQPNRPGGSQQPRMQSKEYHSTCCSNINQSCADRRLEEHKLIKSTGDLKLLNQPSSSEKCSSIHKRPEMRLVQRKLEGSALKFGRTMPNMRKLSRPSLPMQEPAQVASAETVNDISRMDCRPKQFSDETHTDLKSHSKTNFVSSVDRFEERASKPSVPSETNYSEASLYQPIGCSVKQKDKSVIVSEVAETRHMKHDPGKCRVLSGCSSNSFDFEMSHSRVEKPVKIPIEKTREPSHNPLSVTKADFHKEREKEIAPKDVLQPQIPEKRTDLESVPCASVRESVKKTGDISDGQKYNTGVCNPAVLRRDDRSGRLKKETSQNKDVFSYGLVAGVQLRHGSRDDSACSCPNVTPKVRRHASVVVLRHSLIETAPLSVWSSEQHSPHAPSGKAAGSKEGKEKWGTAVGVDVDMVAASIRSQGEAGTSFSKTAEVQHHQTNTHSNYSSEISRRHAGEEQLRSPQPTRKQHYL